MPAGMLNDETYSVNAIMRGYDDLCPSEANVIDAIGQVISKPDITVFKVDVLNVIQPGDELTYRLEFVNVGSGPAQGTFVVDRIPGNTVFVEATGPQGERVYFSDVASLPPPVLSATDPIDATDIAMYFTLGILNDGGTPGMPADDTWTSPFGEQTAWIAWAVDSDGDTDLPVGCEFTSNNLYKDKADMTGTNFTLVDAGDFDNASDQSHDLALLDIDGDAVFDLVEAVSGNNRAYRNDGSGFYTLFRLPAGISRPIISIRSR